MKPETAMRIWVLVMLAALVATGWLAHAQQPFKPGKLPKDEIAKLQPGLTLRFFTPGNDLALDARRVRLAALHIPEASPHSALLPPGRCEARIAGLLKLDLKGEYTFKLLGSGDAVLRLNNQEVVQMKGGAAKESAAVELVKGYNKIDLHYTAPDKGDATLRVYWKGEGFDWEPLPADA